MWQIRDRKFRWGERTYLMGVINVTPDSFSDGGLFNSVDTALAQAHSMAADIDIFDIGGESTRPGAEPVDAATEMSRVVPVIEAIRAAYTGIPISIDTTKVEVAAAAVRAGADIVNDVSAGRFDLGMLPWVGKQQVPIVLMHMQGQPRTMQNQPSYKNVVKEVSRFLADGIYMTIACGLPPDLIAIDPGIGFGKSLEHNLVLLRSLKEFKHLNCPILVGVSRKSFIGKLCNQDLPSDRLWGTAAACTSAIGNGADILRVHDVKAIKDVCLVSDAIYRF